MNTFKVGDRVIVVAKPGKGITLSECGVVGTVQDIDLYATPTNSGTYMELLALDVCVALDKDCVGGAETLTWFNHTELALYSAE
jgi:hypothetical protein